MLLVVARRLLRRARQAQHRSPSLLLPLQQHQQPVLAVVHWRRLRAGQAQHHCRSRHPLPLPLLLLQPPLLWFAFAAVAALFCSKAAGGLQACVRRNPRQHGCQQLLLLQHCCCEAAP